MQYPGAIYHVMNRGDRREPIFLEDEDRRKFLETLGETSQKTGWQIHAYCLMDNHFHLGIETPRANLVAGMKWLLGTDTSRFNRRHRLSGHLFSGRYKADFPPPPEKTSAFPLRTSPLASRSGGRVTEAPWTETLSISLA